VEVYANGDVRKKWEGIREWVEDKRSEIKIIVERILMRGRGSKEDDQEGEIEEERRRRSRDKKVNREGRYLLGALEEAGWFIFNGGGKGDKEKE